MKRQIEVIELAGGEIVLNIEEAQRMKAITEIAMAINKVATALTATPTVTISGCLFSSMETGISVKDSVEDEGDE